MDKIKKYWKEIVIGLLICFSMSKCTQSCSRDTQLNKNKIEYTTTLAEKDSLIGVLNDSINSMSIQLQVYKEKISGLNQALVIQDEANKRIADAKKNIQVNVRQQK